MKQAKAVIEAIYISGWQVAADVMGVPTIVLARTDAQAVLAANPGQLLTYNCSPSFN